MRSTAPFLEIQPVRKLNATVEIPGSKSYTNRALLVAALADGNTILHRILHSDDTERMSQGLRAFGAQLSFSSKDVTIQGCGGRFEAPKTPVFLGNAGTAMRFLTTLASLAGGPSELTGVERMHQRPIQDLLEALGGLGVTATAKHANGCPPVMVQGGGLKGGHTTLYGSSSSQYLSSILLSAPYAQTDVVIDIDGELASKPYVDMTLDVMESFGVHAEHEDYRRFSVAAGQRYQSRDYLIEADASNASYFLASAAVTGGQVTVRPISSDSRQGDLAFVDLLAQMGCHISRGSDWLRVEGRAHRGIEVDLNAIPDMVQTLAVVAAFAESPTRIDNVANLRIKETDRLTAVSNELSKLGAEVEEREDGLTIHPRPLHGAEIATYDDHRMAMSFAVAGLVVPGVKILDPDCVSKTFPDFFDRFQAMCDS